MVLSLGLLAGALRFKALDPMADTESEYRHYFSDMARLVSRHSIRWRILKVLGCILINEDAYLFQGTRSDGGY